MSDETMVRARTRRAILDAAVLTLSQNHGASLGDIASCAGVGRTTLHRYFADRSELTKALSKHVLERIETATVRAALAEGPVPQALERLCQEYFEIGDIMMFMFADPDVMGGPEWKEPTPSDHALLKLVERGHSDKTIDPEVTPLWVQQVMWAMLFAAWQHTRENNVPKHQALSLCLRSLRKAIAA